MSRAEFTIDALVYSDVAASNDPQQRDFDYKKSIFVSSLNNPQSQILTLPNSSATSISLPSASVNWLYIETDQSVSIRFNGDILDNVIVEPSVSGVSDGVLFKRGSITSLSINVAGTTDANVRIFAGS